VIELGPQPLLRLVTLAVAVVLLQVTAISQVELLGSNVDLTPLVVVAVGLSCGALTGAAFGFGVGLLADTLLVQTLGVSSLVFIAIGYLAGRLLELRDPVGRAIPAIIGSLATLLSLIGFGLISFLLGIDAPVSLNLIWVIVASVILNAIVSTPLFAATRRWLAPILPEVPGRPRKRAYTTGGLSPLSRP
jgi:rod shape-determining protein MreD